MTAICASIAVPGRFHAFDLARELHDRGALHRLLTVYPKYHAQSFGVPRKHVRSFWPLLIVNKTVERAFPAFAHASYGRTNLAFSRLAAHFLDGTNIFHGFAGYSWHSLMWAKRQQVPVVIDRSSSHLQSQTELLRDEYLQLGLSFDEPPPECLEREQDEYAQADLIAVPSLFVKRSFLRRGFAEEKLLYAPFGTNTKGFYPAAETPAHFRAIFVGQLSVRKGIHYLLHAFASASISGAELLLVGSPTLETRKLAARATNNVRFLGHVPQAKLLEHYQSASVFVIASLEEGLAVVQAQALACGLPLICTANTGGEDLLRMTGKQIAAHDGEVLEFPAGYVVPIRDPEAIARCLRWLAGDRELLASKRAAARAMRANGLDWARYAETILSGYRTLLEGPVPTTRPRAPSTGASS